jgi:ABC-type transport system substrate-binding protein
LDGLARNTYLNVDLPDWGDIFPRSWAYTPQPDPNAYDPAAARALLSAAGWEPGPDGIRQKDGKRLEVELRTVAGVMVRENAEVVIQQQLRAVGFDVEVHNAPANMLFAPFGAGGLLATGKFDLGIYAWTKNPDPDDSDTPAPATYRRTGRTTPATRGDCVIVGTKRADMSCNGTFVDHAFPAHAYR